MTLNECLINENSALFGEALLCVHCEGKSTSALEETYASHREDSKVVSAAFLIMEACKGRRTTVLDIESLGNVYKFKTYQLYHSIMWSTLYALVAASLTLLALAPSATQRTAWGLGFEAFATIILTIDVAIYASIVHTRTDPWTCVRFIIVVIFVVDLIRASMLHEKVRKIWSVYAPSDVVPSVHFAQDGSCWYPLCTASHH